VAVASGTWCADSYYRSLPGDTPSNFVVSAPGYVYDQTLGVMWTAAPLPQDFTNPQCCGKGPLGDQPFVDLAMQYCGNLTYGGLPWRLPSRSEMHRLMDHNHTNPAINTNFFTANSSHAYWTTDRSPVQDYILNAYAIYGSDGGITYDGDVGYSTGQGAFCVATVVTKLPPAEGQYLVRSAHIVHDSYTGLDWTEWFADIAYPGPGIVAQLAYCVGLNVDGLADWRLPAIKELVSIHPDHNNPRSPLWNHTVFEVTSSNWFWWASTPNRLLQGYYWAWTNGDGVAYINVSPGHARCIRGLAHQYDPALQITSTNVGSRLASALWITFVVAILAG